jgi:F420-dependent oxidoreductase-like protein
MSSMARLAESLGYDSLWRGEAYGGDAVSVLAYIAARTSRIRLGTAVMQMPARTPAMTAMTAISLDQLSGGRAMLGLGMSGPQVVEGWHGVPYESPLATTEDYVAIVRKVIAGDGKVEHAGRRFELPYRKPGSTGLGKAIRPGIHTRGDIPVYLAAIGPKNVALAARVADGLLPMLWNPYRWKQVYGDALDATAGRSFKIIPTVPVAIGDDLAACRDKVRPLITMYVGGMGAKGHNFYNELVRRYGFAAVAEEVQDRYLSGDRRGAANALPDRLVDELALVGDQDRIADQLSAWKESGVTTLVLATGGERVLRSMAEVAL